jgi:hypothetical protein
MELDWAHRIGLILYIFTGINLIVTVVFRASVTAQRGAYATSVLVLVAAAALVAFLDCRRRAGGFWGRRAAWGYGLAGLVFLVAALGSMVSSPAGLLIAAGFIAAILVSSMVSRALRSIELRFQGFDFKDTHSQFLWQCLEYLEFPILVPHRPGGSSLVAKEQRIRQRHRLVADVPIVFVEVELAMPAIFTTGPLSRSCRKKALCAPDQPLCLDPACAGSRSSGAVQNRAAAGDPLRLVKHESRRG